MSDVFLFPGQGSEAPGMGGEALTRPGPVRTLLERASKAMSVDLPGIIERGTPQLARTEVSQPALLCIGVGLALEALARGTRPLALAGHSVGELAAFCVAGCLAPEEAVDVVLDRARLMGEAARTHPGGMAAVREPVEGYEVAAHNAPREWVVTGDREALAKLSVAHTRLPVAGPWHSRHMAKAAEQWRASLQRVQWKRPRFPVVANANGEVIEERDDLAELLVAQLTQPVRWAASVQTLVKLGAKRWHFFGPEKVLKGLLRANEALA
ncbi:MAG: ACP S-malonyltransferase [Archangiaceae bacterium]|nr:ACP S-malonyltransferase [Archangiaceae bacterium]